MEADFGGYATKAGLKCSDGRTIMPDAFKHQDKVRVPLVWQHGHSDPENVLGHAILENRTDGVYAYGFFNDTKQGKNAKALVEHEDIDSLSIWANGLTEKMGQVFHGNIKELSLVLGGANPGAKIDQVRIAHSSDPDDVTILEDEAIIFTGLSLQHGDALKHEAGDDGEGEGPTVDELKEIYEDMDDDEKNVVHYFVGQALEAANKEGAAAHSDDGKKNDTNVDDKNKANEGTLAHTDNKEGTGVVKHNVFDQNGGGTQTADRPKLTHEQLETIVADAKRLGSYKESFLAHAVEYGIENIDILFPEARTLQNAPELISRRMEWVNVVINGANKSPFSRIKSISADITHDEARAKGYVKATLKKEEWFALAKRITTPTTVYKKQKLDRDDIVDITDLDVVAWLKAEMRLMLDEELARAILVSDGRAVDDEDKIKDPASGADGIGIRSIAYDDDFYSHKVVVPANVVGDALVEAILRARPTYRGSGNPTMFCTENVLTDLMLVKDKMGRRLYPTQGELESALRVSKIVTVPVMESQAVNGGELLAILVNMNDYTIGADAGGKLAMFDDFDIDFNQYKYLIETRCSGTLTKFKSALVFTRGAGALVPAGPDVPTFNAGTGVVTIPVEEGVIYTNQDTGAVLAAGAQPALAPGETLSVEATTDAGHYFAPNTDTTWDFTRPLA